MRREFAGKELMDLKEEWIQLAKELNFEFKEGFNAVLESKVVSSLMGGEFGPEGAAVFQTPIMQAILSRVFLGMATGKSGNYEFFVFKGDKTTSRNRTSYYVRTILAFPNSLGIGLNIEPSGFFDRLIRSIFPGKTVHTGNSDLDTVLSIKADDQQKALRFLQSDTLKLKMLAFQKISPELRINDHGLLHTEPGEIASATHIQEIMAYLTGLADEFCARNS
ncbi:MAG: hypothetical protein HQM09_16310 [Candidatus Riflebacteria bacterium]|nr:hypothetical protein [Candidatus Riflebacteria bacterium]